MKLEMLKLTTSHGASVRGSHPLKIAKGGASSVVVVKVWKGWATPPLLQGLHHRRWTSDLGFSDQQMDVFGHDHVSHHHKAVTLTGLFENGDKAVAFTRTVQKR
jgi:hypothetical protein